MPTATLLQLFDALFGASPDAALLTRPNGQVLTANKAACRLFGADAATLAERGRAGLVDASDPRLAVLLAERAEHGATRGIVWLRRASGERFEAELSATLFADRDNTIGSLLTVREPAAEQRSAAEDRARLAAVIDGATDAILIVDADARLMVFNPSAEELFGCPAERALGRPLTDFVQLPSPLPTLHHRAGVDVEGLRSNRTRFPAEASFSLGSAEGRTMTTVILRDASQSQALHQAREALESAEAANRAKTDFIAHMSHELRTPLNAIIGFSDLMMQDASAPLPPLQRQRISLVRDAGSHLLAMIGDLLDVARAEAGHLQVAVQRVALRQPLAEAVAIVQPIADTARLTLHFVPETLPVATLQADPLRLRQVIVNLLGNAIKYNRPHGSLTLRARMSDGGIAIDVEDTGIGMRPDQTQRLFQPFERVGREHSRIEGTGLGLSLSRQLVDAMGGRLTVESSPGVGSTFTVWLPRAG